MPVAIFSGWMGFVCLFFLGISNLIVVNFGQDYLSEFHVSELGATLYLAAFLSVPLAALSIKKWRETKTNTQAVFFIPVHFFVILLAVLGYIFRDYVPQDTIPSDM